VEPRDRRANLAFFAAALVAWLAVGWIVVTHDPVLEPMAGYAGAVAMGLGVGLTTVPLFWLVPFARHGRIAYRGGWTRAIRRGGWVGFIVILVVVLRLQDFFQLPLVLFIIVLALVAETTLSAER
jgi:hypothetical protein